MKKNLINQISVLCWIIIMGASVVYYRFISSCMTSGEYLIAMMVWVGVSFDMLDRIR